MPSVDSNSSYSSSDSSTSSLSSPRVLLTDIRQQQAIKYDQHQMKATTTTTPPPLPITPSHICVTRYKTELCRPFTETGKCKYGDKCQFSHGIKELRILMRHPKYKTEYCRTFHTTGYCPYGPRCHFIHDVHEARITTNTNDTPMRRHSDIRSNQSIQKLANRNRITSDYTALSSSPTHIIPNINSSKSPFSFQDISRALLSYENSDIIQQQYQQSQKLQQQQHQQHKQEYYSSILSPMTNSSIYRTFSSSSSSNSSLAPQYV
ncbi:unnamed protein product [Rotaria magnacalcarata]|uniref:C3H1-type domain-containing protein n=1 Tax=Rotaria magnacalcarata TaxID=392030 RepID=A0A817AD92_9BILA|nr:unnamed protein product [Rotaria magnacalcarata]CAF1387166.1 unnamed protein product [Rotaria magnacalcarata]CAF2245270.1 unnamed protein product [Rotaria magnacalcarata]CAF3808316.1 unnamed protein product [Rotaria magnacalcarata]CAF3990880.1 unnamed protein product [Rotaria magnacalcarata]